MECSLKLPTRSAFSGIMGFRRSGPGCFDSAHEYDAWNRLLWNRHGWEGIRFGAFIRLILLHRLAVGRLRAFLVYKVTCAASSFRERLAFGFCCFLVISNINEQRMHSDSEASRPQAIKT